VRVHAHRQSQQLRIERAHPHGQMDPSPPPLHQPINDSCPQPRLLIQNACRPAISSTPSALLTSGFPVELLLEISDLAHSLAHRTSVLPSRPRTCHQSSKY
jgi:hypothetical protein